MFSFVLACILLTACGGGGSDGGSGISSSTSPSFSNENLSGLWDGTITENGLTYAVRGLLFDENPNDGLPADFYAISLDAEAIYLGALTLSGNNFTGSAGMYVIGGEFFDQTTLTGVGNAKGTIQATGTSNSGVSSISLNYDASYDQPSSFDIVTGIWNTYDAFGNITSTMTVQDNGSFSGDNTAGCQFNGDFSIINSSQNLYLFTLSYFGCVSEGYVAEGYASFFDDNSINGRIETVYGVSYGDTIETVIFLEMFRASD